MNSRWKPGQAQLLLALVSPKQVGSVEEAIKVLEKLNLLLLDSPLENLLPFNAVYVVITQQLGDGIQSGVFRNPTAMAELDVCFVRYYLQAITSYIQEGSFPPAWRHLLTPGLPSFAYALLGANVHVSHDLALAIQAVGNGQAYIRDFHQADALIANSFHSALNAYLATTGGRAFLRRVGFLYYRPVLRLIIRWRHLAWVHGIALEKGSMTTGEVLRLSTNQSNLILIGMRGVAWLGLARLFPLAKKVEQP